MFVKHPSTPAFGPRALTKFDVMGIRFMADGEGADAGAGDGESQGSDAGLGDAGQKAIDRMKETVKTTKAELKAYADLGLTAAEIKAIVDEKNAGKPVDEDAIRTKAERDATTAATEKFHGKLRASSVREQAAALGFIDPKDALTGIKASDLAEIEVDDDDEVDGSAVKKLLEKLATEKPYLLKPTDTTPGHKQVGIGGTGSGAKPDVQPGTPRMREAYANATHK